MIRPSLVLKKENPCYYNITLKVDIAILFSIFFIHLGNLRQLSILWYIDKKWNLLPPFSYLSISCNKVLYWWVGLWSNKLWLWKMIQLYLSSWQQCIVSKQLKWMINFMHEGWNWITVNKLILDCWHENNTFFQFDHL